jgi:hypothetical protein
MSAPIQLIQPAPVADVVDVLRSLLARAEAGEVTGVAVAFALQGRSVGSVYVLGEAAYADLYLTLDRLKLRLLDGK